MDELSLLMRLSVALAIGLLVGLERGWRSRDEVEGQRIAGLRTFALTGLLGGVAGALTALTQVGLLGFAFLGFAIAFTAFHLLEARAGQSRSVTAVVAGLCTFLLGAYALLGDQRVAVAGAVAMTGLLAMREPLHQWLRTLRWEEIRAVLILLAMTFLLLPVLPNRTVDPWDSLNPAEIWLLAILIAAISFGGYVAVRLFGERLGVVMAALAGGLASSTATTLTLARLGRQHPDSARLLAAGILLAGVVMVLRVGAVALLLNPALAGALLPALAVAALVQAVASLALLARNTRQEQPDLAISNPLDLATALKLAGFIALVLLAAQAVRDWVGNSGVLLVAAASGIADVDAVTISMARMADGTLAVLAAQAIATAVAVNTLSKAVIAAWVGGRGIGAYVGGASIAALGAGAAVLLT
ncbi:MgtC/SapB family protein [Oleisolibacter albus]|uniref:MgtC/SapB family protein n=1 Tax=Oleisolibacter albus TaxID=2171757 RepID=UPI000DF2B366|nr:MgtC/SapB family protein [Oleisolibacter albus]